MKVIRGKEERFVFSSGLECLMCKDSMIGRSISVLDLVKILKLVKLKEWSKFSEWNLTAE